MLRAPVLLERSLTLVLTILLFVTAIPVATASPQSDAAAKQKKAEELRAKAAEARDAAEQLNAEARAFDAEIDIAQDRVDEIQPQKNEAIRRASEVRAEVAALEESIAVKGEEIKAKQKEYDFQKAELDERVRAMYRTRSNMVIELLLTSASVEDFIQATDLLNRIVKADGEVVDTLTAEREDLETAKADLEATLAELNIRKAEIEALEKELVTLDSQYRSSVANLENTQAAKDRAMQDALSDAKKWEAQAAEEEAEGRRILAAISSSVSSGSGIVEGAFSWPVPASQRITSTFGNRTLFGRTQFHNAIDIGAPNGTAVVAATNGIVIKAEYGWGGGYGNRIWIDHGNGVVTCYNHLSSIAVSQGSSVSRGQTIGGVGSTGFSTGPHLDFQVIVNGAFQNPMGYY